MKKIAIFFLGGVCSFANAYEVSPEEFERQFEMFTEVNDYIISYKLSNLSGASVSFDDDYCPKVMESIDGYEYLLGASNIDFDRILNPNMRGVNRVTLEQHLRKGLNSFRETYNDNCVTNNIVKINIGREDSSLFTPNFINKVTEDYIKNIGYDVEFHLLDRNYEINYSEFWDAMSNNQIDVFWKCERAQFGPCDWNLVINQNTLKNDSIIESLNLLNQAIERTNHYEFDDIEFQVEVYEEDINAISQSFLENKGL